MAMTDRATLQALLNRVLEGEGPDRELDSDITRMLLPHDADAVTRSRYGWSYSVFGPDGWDDEWLENKSYTTSLDAALTLVPEGYWWQIANGKRRHYDLQAGAELFFAGGPNRGDMAFSADAATPARAFIAACIKARMEAQPLSNP